MKFIGSEQLKYKKAIKDGKVVDKNTDNLIAMPTNTAISFADMVVGARGSTITMTATYTNPSNGKVTQGNIKLTLA